MTGAPNPPSCAASLAWMLQRLSDRVASWRFPEPLPDPAADPASSAPTPVG